MTAWPQNHQTPAAGLLPTHLTVHPFVPPVTSPAHPCPHAHCRTWTPYAAVRGQIWNMHIAGGAGCLPRAAVDSKIRPKTRGTGLDTGSWFTRRRINKP
jgi:hypothetical protein